MVLSKIINQLANPTGGVPGGFGGGRRRHLYIPPSTKTPLFSLGEGDDRSFLSLIESGNVTDSDVASVSTSRSLPSTLSSAQTVEDQESFHSWLLEENQRRHYSATNSPEDNLSIEDNRARRGSYRSSKSSGTISLSSSFNVWEDYEHLHSSFYIEFVMLLRYAFPLVLAFLLEHFFSLVSLLVVGHLGKKELAAVSLASMSSTITFGIFDGIATALDTLCPQAYGAGNYENVSIHVQRCTMFSLVIFIPCGISWWYSRFFLSYIIDDMEVVELTSQFLKILLLGAPGYIFFGCAQRFLQAQGIFEASTGVLFVTAPINIFLSYILVWNEKFGLGYIGAPVASAINFWLMAIFLILYVKFIDGKKCWFGLIPWADMFKQWDLLSHLAIPGVIMMESEFLAYEILTLFATAFGTSALAAHSAVSSIAALVYMIPFAVGTASSTRIANFVGGRNIYSAKIATQVGLLSGLIISLINAITLYLLRYQIAKMFTNEKDVVELIVSLIDPMVACIQIFDGMAAVASGILRAVGLQKIGGAVNFFCYYAIGIPISVVLSRNFNMQLSGLWLGIGIGMFLIGITEVIVILTANWEGILQRASDMNDLYDDELDIDED